MGINPYFTTWIKDFLHNRSQQVLVENNVSHSLPVLYGVPQGSDVGPSLFIAYINDLPGSVRSRVRLFADDTIVYPTLKSHASAQSLQEGLPNLELWEKEWSMEFNPDKCEVLRIHRKKKPIIFPYTLHDTTSRTTENAEYIGITISSRDSSDEMSKHKTKTKRGCIQNICTPLGRILFSHMAPMAETPHIQNKNGSKVSRKVCSK